MISVKEETNEVPIKIINEFITQDDIVGAETEWKTIRRNNCFFGFLITTMTGIIFICFVGILIRKYEVSELSPSSKLVISRHKWINDIGRIGSKRLKTPVSKVIVFDSSVIETCEEETCIKNLADQSFYPFFEDIKVNFLIGTNGKIFEGRGFSREGDTQTSYDNEAISKMFFFLYSSSVINFERFRYKYFMQQLTS